VSNAHSSGPGATATATSVNSSILGHHNNTIGNLLLEVSKWNVPTAIVLV